MLRWLSRSLAKAGSVLFTCLVLQIFPGCGSSPGPNDAAHRTAAYPFQGATTAKQNLDVSSSALPKGRGPHLIPWRYKCQEEAVWLPIQWSAVPPDTSEIAVVVTVTNFEDSPKGVETSLGTLWVIGGLRPNIDALFVGQPPTGAFITGHNVEIPNCPSRSGTSGISFNVFALPKGSPLHDFEAIGLPTAEDIAGRAIAAGSLLTLYGSE
jgi:hypothetical protein